MPSSPSCPGSDRLTGAWPAGSGQAGDLSSGEPGPVLGQTAKGLILAPGERLSAHQVAGRQWNALRGDLDLPVLLLHGEALRWNIETMSRYCAASGVLLAPHAKTAMSPEIIGMQLRAGAWAMTAATAAQVRTLRAFGVRNILLANVLVDAAAIRWVGDHLLASEGFAFCCYVDSAAAIECLDRSLAGRAPGRRLPVLVEVGYPGGRTGARSVGEAVELARRVRGSRCLGLAGVAGYEGLLRDRGAVTRFLVSVRWAAERIHREGLWPGTEPPVITCGGSSYFDLVAAELRPGRFSFPVRTVLRSGCYVTHDHGIYAATSPLGPGRGTAAPRRLRAAFELLASVWSRPEPELLIAGFGRRDVPFDDRLPVALGVRSAAGPPRQLADLRVTGVNDQHAYVEVPAASDIAVGDVLAFGVSHPCGAFDRWRFIPVVDSGYGVTGGVTTYF